MVEHGPRDRKLAAYLSWLIGLGLPSLYVLLALDHAFFWDTVQLASRHAHHYFQTGFSQLLLPEAIDSGHPPTFGMYVAVWWLAFGKSLAVSHLSMFPFALGIGLLLLQLSKAFCRPSLRPLALLLFLVDPVLAGQLTLVSPDVPLAFFFLLAVYALWRNWPVVVALGALGLAMLSMRGMMVAFGLALFSISLPYMRKEGGIPVFMKSLLPFLPAGLFSLLFLGWHYAQTGWIGYHEASEWAASFQPVDVGGFFRNLLVFGWRLLDFGRALVWAALFITWGLWGWRRLSKFRTLPYDMLFMFILTAALALVSLPSFLLYAGLQGHRYLLPLFLSISLLLVVWVSHMLPGRFRPGWILVLALAGLLTGNIWVYPKRVAQGWDSTLAHLPYYDLRQELIGRLDAERIPLGQVGSKFPNLGPLEYLDLNGRLDGFVEADLREQSYIFYSNIMNDFTDEELRQLESWIPMYLLRKGGVEVVLYERPY